MPTRHGDRLAKRASTWPRDHFCRSTIAPRSSWPTTWNEFLPISMPITAIALSNFWDMACSLSLAPLPSILSLVGQQHGRTIPLSDIGSERHDRRQPQIDPRCAAVFQSAFVPENAGSARQKMIFRLFLGLQLQEHLPLS